MKTKLNPLGLTALVFALAVINAAANTLWWEGANTNWDINTSLNWANTSSGLPAKFNNGDSVIFDNHTVGITNIWLVTNVQPAAITVDTASYNFIFTGTNAIAGTGSLSKISAGTLTINTTNNYSGGTTVGGGSIVVTTPNAGQFGTGSITLTNSGTLQMFRSTTTDDGSTSAALTNALIVPTGQTGVILNMPRGTLSSSLTGGGTLNFRADATRGDITGNWSAFTGQINLTGINGGNFRCNNSAGYPLAKINLASGSVLVSRLAITPIVPVGELTGDTGSSLTAAATGNDGLSVVWRVGGLNTSAAYNGNISGTVGLIKEGSGNWTLAGTNTYTGTTTVSVGILTLTNSATLTNSSSITVNAGATLNLAGAAPFNELDIYTNKTLKGGGVVAAVSVVVAAGGTVLPGDGVGVLTVSNGTFSSAGLITMELNRTNATATNDMLKASSITITGGVLTVTNLGPDLHTGDSFKLFSVAIGGSGFTTVALPVSNILNTVQYVWTNRLALDGSIQLLNGASSSPSPTNISYTVGGNQLILNWPNGQGWRLLAQTNNLLTGLTTNWFATGVTTSPFTNTVNPANGTVFYRLTYP